MVQFCFVRLWALSIQPKIPEITVGTSNRTYHFGLVRPKYSRPALKPRWSTLTGLVISVGLVARTDMSLSIWQNCCSHYRSPAYKNNNQTRSGLGRVCATGMYHPLGTWNFRNFKLEFLLNRKRPRTVLGFQFWPIISHILEMADRRSENVPLVPYSNSAPHRSIVTCNLKMVVNCSCWHEITLIIFCPYPELCGTRCAQARGRSRSLFPKRLSGKSEKALNNR